LLGGEATSYDQNSTGASPGMIPAWMLLAQRQIRSGRERHWFEPPRNEVEL